MRHRTVLALLPILAGLMACAVRGGKTPIESPPDLTTAQAVIEKNIEAIGGSEKIRAIRTMTLEGAWGSALLPPTGKVTLYLEKPDRLKRVGLYQILLCREGEFLYNAGTGTLPLPKEVAEEVGFRLGFYHNAFSLLNWEDLFSKAVLEGIRTYGPNRQYRILIPNGVNGRDLFVHIDAGTFLIDRLIYSVEQPGANELQVVCSLRDYEALDGILLPRRVVFDKVGWEVGPNQLVIEKATLNPDLDDGLFQDAVIDFGTVRDEGKGLKGEIFGVLDGSILTNIKQEDLNRQGIKLKSWVELKVGETAARARILDNIQTSAADVRPGELYLCRYPFIGYPRLMIMSFSEDVTAMIPGKKGDALVVTPVESVEPE